MRKSWAVIMMMAILSTAIISAAGCGRNDSGFTTEASGGKSLGTEESAQESKEKFLGVITNIDGGMITVSVEEDVSEGRKNKKAEKEEQDREEKQDQEEKKATLSDIPEGVTDLRVSDEVIVFELLTDTRICKADEGKQVEIEVSGLQKGDFVKLERDNGQVTSILVMNGMPGMDRRESRADEMKNGGQEAILNGVYTLEGEKAASDGENFVSEISDQNAVLVKAGGILNMTNAAVKKTGSTSSQTDSSYWGVNAAVAAIGGGRVQLKDTSVESDGEGTNAVFASGNGTEIDGQNLRIRTDGTSSRGLDAADGGTITAVNLDIMTEGEESAPAAAVQKGNLSIKEGILSSAGAESPCIYSQGTVTAENVTGTADSSRILVIEGKNSAILRQCALTGAGSSGILICQSPSSVDEDGTARLEISDSILTTASDGPMFYILNTKADIMISNSTLNSGSGVLARVSERNVINRKQAEEKGSVLTITANSQVLKGDIICDETSEVTLNLTVNSMLEGAVNGENQAKKAEMSLDQTSSWTLTGDSHVTVLRNEAADNSNIHSNGYTVFYDSSREENSWLEGKTIELQDGGKIMPEQ